MDIKQLKLDIIEVGKRLYSKSYVASNDGNISIMASENTILITPSGVSKGYMAASDILTIDLDGNVLEGSLKPSSEMKMHLAVYRKRPDVKAIVHAHPQKATAFAAANKTFDKVILPEIIFSLGKVALAEYGTPSTSQIPEAVEKHILTSDVLLLANHGALTAGKDVYDAYYKMETLEHYASIYLYTLILGGGIALEDEEIKRLYEIRSNVFGK